MSVSKPGTVPSPCVSICRMRDDGYCEGCMRTLDEIAGWGMMSALEQRRVWKALPARRSANERTFDGPNPS